MSNGNGAATTTTPGLRTLPQQLRNRDKDRLDAYRRALDFYNGNQWPAARANTRLRRLTTNYIRTTVQKTTSYVMKGALINAIPHSHSDAHIAAAEAAEDYLADLAVSNGLARLDMVTELDAAVLGDAAYKVTWDTTEQRVAITSPDMAGVFPWPHPTDPTRFRRLAHRYQLPAADIRATWNIATPNNPAWVIEDWTDAELAIYVDDQLQLGGPNPYGFVPFVLFPNEQVPKRWWGESDVTPLIEIAQELNAEFSRLSNIMELSGNPIAVLTGIETSEGIETFPGALWELPPGAKAEVFDLLKGGAAGQHLNYLERMLITYHDLSETPRTAFGGTERDLSGVALQVELQPLLQKVDRKRIIRNDTYRLRAALALRLSDQFAGTGFTDSIAGLAATFAAITPPDQALDAGREVALVGAGIRSRRTALANLGDPDPDTELQRVIDEAKTLSALALALQPVSPASGP